ALFGGRKKKLLEAVVSNSIAPKFVTTAYLDERGEPLKSTENVLGMATYQVTREEALKALSGDEVDLAVSTLVKTRAIKDARKTERAVYRITTPGEDQESILSAGPSQKIARVDAQTIDLTVDAISPPDEPPASDENPGKEFLAPNSFIQSDD